MRMLQADGDLANNLARFGPGKWPALANKRFQRRTVDELHDQVEAVADLVGVEGGDNVRMVQPGGGADFAMKCLASRCRASDVGAEHLDGHRAVHGPVRRAVHAADGASADLLLYDVLAENESVDAAGE